MVVAKRAVLNRGGRAARLARVGHPTAHRLVPAAVEQRRTVRAVRTALQKLGVAAVLVPVDRLDAAARRRLARARFVITVGGDGTLLSASHHLNSALALGVNSAPGDSVGQFCLTDRRGLGAVLGAIERGRLRPVPVARLAITLDGRRLPETALNDVLVAHHHPAATSRYRLTVRGVTEEQRSSGLWVATGAGSTAGILSAGGRPMRLGSRFMQYRVREPYRESDRRYRLEAGLLAPSQPIVVESKMETGWLFVDGSRTAYGFPFGARLEVRVSDQPLLLFADPSRWRRAAHRSTPTVAGSRR